MREEERGEERRKGNGRHCAQPPHSPTLSPTFTQMSNIGVPIKLLHEAEGHIVTVEMMSGELYRGKLVEVSE